MIYTAKVHWIVSGKEETHGDTVLVDRLWPRGIPKEALHLDFWMKDVAPSPELRRWWAHDPQTFPEFRKRYEQELESNSSDDLRQLRYLTAHGDVSLVFAAHDPEINHAVVLADWLKASAQ
ncbi:MAG: DUF488 family protein [Actinomycetaceae bacterium]|nr:DUF488 family protein [Arcanobacterium sp.]MDD7504453.1 DUF488 family protein [Actinomycetaceae bacterium]MDY6143990.1 DUF488 family protein [Arcanobacterium sp.]